ncbi:DUF4240 domain-containing protein [Streptomyces sp. NPDC001177]
MGLRSNRIDVSSAALRRRTVRYADRSRDAVPAAGFRCAPASPALRAGRAYGPRSSRRWGAETPRHGHEAFWRLLGTAEDSGEPLDDAVAAQLAAMPAEEILAFEHRFTQLRHAIHRWDVWAAAYLIGGGCSDDRFCDFTAGLVALGPHWYNRANACPDELAEHPAVQAAAATGDQEAVFAEDFSFVSCRAYAQLTGNEDGFWEAWETCSNAHTTNEADGDQGMGEPFDFDDTDQMRRRLPRLAALYPAPS